MDEHQDQYMTAIRARSGEVSDDRLLVSFLYNLLRDHIPPGDVEQIMLNLSRRGLCESEQCTLGGPHSHEGVETRFCNGWLASYAQDLADRLEGKTLA